MLKIATALVASAYFSTSLSIAQVSDARSAWTTVSGNLVAAASKFPESGYGLSPTRILRFAHRCSPKRRPPSELTN
jgi:hypothetical protein